MVAEAGVLVCSFDHGVCDWMSDREGDLHWEVQRSPAGLKQTNEHHLTAATIHSFIWGSNSLHLSIWFISDIRKRNDWVEERPVYVNRHLFEILPLLLFYVKMLQKVDFIFNTKIVVKNSEFCDMYVKKVLIFQQL